jgi:hypothetical protein
VSTTWAVVLIVAALVIAPLFFVVCIAAFGPHRRRKHATENGKPGT